MIDQNITFTTPTQSISLSNDPLTRQNFTIPLNNNTVGFYVRTQNVTSLVANGQNGIYSVKSIPALIEAIDNTTNETNHAGWTLAVIYSNQNLPFRSLNLWAGGEVVSPLIGVSNITLTGFKAPNEANPSGKLFVSAQEGDAVISGDQMLFGETALVLNNLSGPNNPQNNFFCSQINNENGLIETSGTFGTRNANAVAGTNTSACRQGYDITTIDLTGKLLNEQTTAYVRFTSNGDLYVPNCIGIQIDNGVNPNLSVIKSVDKLVAVKNEVLTYTSLVTNTGSIPNDSTIFTDEIPAGTTFIDGSVYVDGVNFPTYNPQIGFDIGNLIPNQTVTVKFQVIIN